MGGLSVVRRLLVRSSRILGFAEAHVVSYVWQECARMMQEHFE